MGGGDEGVFYGDVILECPGVRWFGEEKKGLFAGRGEVTVYFMHSRN